MKVHVTKFLLSLFIAFIVCKPLLAAEQKSFDFYVLSLSWSPEFCDSHPRERQCGRGYGLVLHGVWPQYQSGYPQSCRKTRMPARLAREFADLYPSEKLVFHEWKKHGTCSELTPRAYLQFSQKLKQGFIEPTALKNLTKPLRTTATQLKQQIVSTNPYLNSEAIAFSCAGSGRFLQEIYVCLDKSGTGPVECSTELQRRSRRSCGQADFLIRNVR